MFSMKRNRAAGIVIRDGKILLMHRINKGDEYWVFPGGGQEKGETQDQTAVREIAEETTVRVKAGKLLYHITWDTAEENFFYLCEYLSGEPRLDENSEEFAKAQGGEQIYEPSWVEVDKIANIKLYQLEVRDLLLRDYQAGFLDQTQELFIKLAERRHK